MFGYPSRGDEVTDSLNNVAVSEAYHDTVRVNALIELSKYYLYSDYSLAIDYAQQAQLKAKSAQFGRGLGYAYKWAGVVYYFQSQYLEALSEWERAYAVFDSIQEKRGMANILSNMGAVYFDTGENTRALENYLESLKLSKEIDDKLRIATVMINIGAVYFDKPTTLDQALDYYLQALVISEQLNNVSEGQKKRAIGTACINIGEVYLIKREDAEALRYFQRALDEAKGTDIETSAWLGYGNVFALRKEYDKAIQFQNQAYLSALKTEQQIDMVRATVDMAESYTKMGDEKMSISKYKETLPMALEISAVKELRDIYYGLAQNYRMQSRYDSAFKYQVLFGDTKDTLFKIAEKGLTALRLKFELEQKESKIEQLNIKQELDAELLQRAKTINYLVIAGFLSVFIFLTVALRQKKRIEKEKQRSDELLLNILPKEVAEELKEKGSSEARHYDEVTVLFTDFKGFTGISSVLSAQELVEEVNYFFRAFDDIVTKYNIEKIKTIGDAYMVAGGVPLPDDQSVVNVVLAAFEMQKVVEDRMTNRIRNDVDPFTMRIGIHTGSVVAGIVGVKKFQYDIWGDTVNTASRMETNGEIGKINISQTTYEKIKNTNLFDFEKREQVEVKGKGEMQMYFVKLRKSV